MFHDRSDGALAKRGALICSGCAVWLCVAQACCAQSAQTPGPVPHDSPAQAESSLAHPARTDSATAHEYPVGKASTESAGPTVPTATHAAKLTFKDGKLTIESNNSDLSQNLQDVAHISGMTINGLNGGPRVFGIYGPGNSREVLTALLIGSGYNFMMVGGASNGTPRELLLTPQTRNAPALNPVNPAPAEADESGDAALPDSERNPSPSIMFGPGALAPAPSRNDLDDDTRVQKTLQRLQHQQEQPQQPQPQPQN
jgi:hypothetical protein